MYIPDNVMNVEESSVPIVKYLCMSAYLSCPKNSYNVN